MPPERSEEGFERGFAAYQRGDLLSAPGLFEAAYRADPTFEAALLNYARTLRALKLGDRAADGALRLVSEAASSPAALSGPRGGAPGGRGRAAG